MNVDDMIGKTIESDDREPLLRELEKMQTTFLTRCKEVCVDRAKLPKNDWPIEPRILAVVIGNVLHAAVELLRSGHTPDWTDSTLICELSAMLGIREFPQFAD